jgi:hypothetical protein
VNQSTACRRTDYREEVTHDEGRRLDVTDDPQGKIGDLSLSATEHEILSMTVQNGNAIPRSIPVVDDGGKVVAVYEATQESGEDTLYVWRSKPGKKYDLSPNIIFF